MPDHDALTTTDIHTAVRWTVADAAALAALVPAAADIGKVAWQQDVDTYYILKNNVGPVWTGLGGLHAASHADGGADELEADDLAGAAGAANQVLVTDGAACSWGQCDNLAVTDGAVAGKVLVSDGAGAMSVGAHDDISGAGVNTHTQIDTHLAATTNPHATKLTQEMHKVTAGETAAGYFTLAGTPNNAASITVDVVGGPRQVNKQAVGATGATPDFDVNQEGGTISDISINNTGGAAGLSGDITTDDILIVCFNA